MVNNLFLHNKLYLMRMNDGDSITEPLNAFNIVISQLLSVDIKITEEEKCISLLCCSPDSWDNFVMAIGRKNSTLKIDNVVATLFLEEMRRKTMEGFILEALLVRGRFVSRKKGKPSSGRSKSRGMLSSRSTTLGQSKRRCWTCRKLGHYKKYCKLKGVSTSKDL